MKDHKLVTQADIELLENIPIEERMNFTNTYDLIKYSTKLNPDAPALSYFSSGNTYKDAVVVTYREFLSNVTRTANLFHDLGVGPRDVVSFLLPNMIETHYVLWGAETAGIVNPLNQMLEAPSLVNLCRAAKTKVLVAIGDDEAIWQKALQIKKNLPELKALISINGPGDEKEGIFRFEEMITRYQGETLDSGRIINPDDISSMLYTGGTTGLPKLAPRTHFNEACMPVIANMLNILEQGETILGATPLFHALAPTSAGTLAFVKGAHVVIPREGFRDPAVGKNIYKIIEHYQIVLVFLVPTIMLMLIDAPIDSDISCFRYSICGGAPLSTEIINRFESKTSARVLQGYGLTESTAYVFIDHPEGDRRPGSMGMRLPYVHPKVFILDGAGNFAREAEPNEIGSLCVQGPNVFKGYMDPDHNRDAWPREGWLNTGDLARQDGEGYFWFTGRRKELIKRSGHNIDPAVVEMPLYKLEGVAMAAAVAKPDRTAGEVVAVYVQPKEGYNLTEERVLEHLKETVEERAAIPKDVVILQTMPLTAVGKIFKPSLHWDAIRRTYEKELEVLQDMAESVFVTVGEDKVLGVLATIKVKPSKGNGREDLEKRISDILVSYNIGYRVEFV